MALAGVHITFGSFAGGFGDGTADTILPYKPVASQTMAGAGTSTISAPSSRNNDKALCSICASAAIFYAVGPTPDTTNGPLRYYDPAWGRPEDIFVDAGDKVGWKLA